MELKVNLKLIAEYFEGKFPLNYSLNLYQQQQNIVAIQRFLLEYSGSACMYAQSCQTVCNPMGCSPPGSSVHGIFQARILEWITISYSRGSSQPRDQTMSPTFVGIFFTTEPPGKPTCSLKSVKIVP